MLNNKKGEIVSIITLVILVLVIVGYGIKVSTRECSSNSDCKDTQYCGSDYECHDQKIIVVYKYSLIIPAIILAKGLVISAYILKKKKNKKEELQQNNQQQENPYYNN